MSLTTRPFAHVKELDDLGRENRVNIAKPERIASVAGGIALALYGLSRKSFSGAALSLLGGALIYRGSVGRCELYGKLGVNTALPRAERGVHGNKGIKVERAIHVNRPAGDVFRFWRHLENLPRFMPHLESVEEKTDRLSHWVVKGPLEQKIAWDAEIINEHPGSMISWQSLPGADVQSAGTVRFDSEEGGSRVSVNLQYYPTGGAFGAKVAKILGDAPEQQIDQDLARFKELIESEAA